MLLCNWKTFMVNIHCINIPSYAVTTLLVQSYRTATEVFFFYHTINSIDAIR